MEQRRVVIADHDSQGVPRLTETQVPAGEPVYQRQGVGIRWRRLEPGASFSTPGGTHQYQLVVIKGRLVAPDAAPLLPGDALITADLTSLRAEEPTDLMIMTVGLGAANAGESTATESTVTLTEPGTLGTGVRRVVLASDGAVRQDGEPPNAVSHKAGITATQVWQTGGPLRSADGGGDVPGPFRNGPEPGGVMLQAVQLDPAGYRAGANDWHATPTIDIDVVVSGELELALPGYSTVLHPGDMVVQYGTEHAWTPRGDQVVRLMAVMLEPA